MSVGALGWHKQRGQTKPENPAVDLIECPVCGNFHVPDRCPAQIIPKINKLD